MKKLIFLLSALILSFSISSQDTIINNKANKNVLSIRPGLGLTYANTGIKSELRSSGNFNYGIELTLPFFREMWGTYGFGLGLGFKYYFYKNLYLNVNHTKMGKREEYRYNFNSNAERDFNVSYTCLVLGLDMIKYLNKIGYGLNFGIGAGYEKQQPSNLSGLYPMFDLGIIFAFGL